LIHQTFTYLTNKPKSKKKTISSAPENLTKIFQGEKKKANKQTNKKSEIICVCRGFEHFFSYIWPFF